MKKLRKKLRDIVAAEGWLHPAALAVLFLAGTGMRIAYLSQPLCHDEAYNYLAFAMRPLGSALSFYPSPNNQLFHTLLVKLTTWMAGEAGVKSLWVIRLPAFLAGVLVIPATYLVVRKLFDRNAALLATALVVPSSVLVEYSANARGYTIVTVIFLALVLLAARIIRKGGALEWACFVLLSLLGFWTIPTMLYFFGAVLAWVVLEAFLGKQGRERRSLLAGAATACASTAVLVVLVYVPVVVRSGLASITSNFWVKSLPFSEFAGKLPASMRATWRSWTAGYPIWVNIIIAVGFAASFFAHARTGRQKVNIAYPVIAWCLLLVLARRNLPPERVWMPLLPLFFGLAAAGLCWIGAVALRYSRGRLEGRGRRRLTVRAATAAFTVAVVVACALLSAWIVSGGAPYQPEDQITLRDADRIARALEGELKPGDVVVFNYVPSTILRYYFLAHGVPLSHLFVAPELAGVDRAIYGGGFDYGMRPRRVFIIEAPKEGYPLGSVLEYGKIDGSQFERAKPFRKLSHSNVYVIDLGGG